MLDWACGDTIEPDYLMNHMALRVCISTTLDIHFELLTWSFCRARPSTKDMSMNHLTGV